MGGLSMKNNQVLEEVIEAIKQFRPVSKEIIINTEEEFNLLLAYWIAGWLRRANIKATVEVEHKFEKVGEESRTDILVKGPLNEKIAIEIKIVKTIQDAKNLLGEVQTDLGYFKDVIAVVIETRKKYDYRWYESHLNSFGVIIKGRREKIKRKEGKKTVQKQRIILGPLKSRFVVKKM